jgi:hypothetical protein
MTFKYLNILQEPLFFIQNIININKNDFKNIKSILDIKDGFCNIYLNMK